MLGAKSHLVSCLAADTSGDASLFLSFDGQRVSTGPSVRVGQQN
jgi:hypothetical protein